MKDYPEVLYVKREDEGTENEIMLCDEDVTNLAESEETISVAVYHLHEVVKVQNETAIL